MKCPYCNASTEVTNSRPTSSNQSVWRRRQCKNCSAIWTTKETYELTKTHRVLTRHNNSLQPFYRDKLFVSIMNSLKHSNDALEASSDLTDTIIGNLLADKTEIIHSSHIIAVTIDVLKRYDPVASAVHKATHQR